MRQFIFLLFVFYSISLCALPKVWHMPTPYAETVHHTQIIHRFAQRIAQDSKQQLSIKVHSANSLIKHSEIYRAVRSSQVAIGEIIISRLGNLHPIYKVDNIPFLATSFVEAKKLYRVTRRALVHQLSRQGITLLYAVPWPAQDLYTKFPVHKIADLRGTKLRSYSATSYQLIALMQAVPINIPYSDIAQAFGTNTIQGMITSPSSCVSSQCWEFVEHYRTIHAWIPKNMVIVNTKALQKLPPELQLVVHKAAQSAETYGWQKAENLAEQQIAILRENSIVVETPTPRLMMSLQNIGNTMIADWLSEIGEQGKDIITDYHSRD